MEHNINETWEAQPPNESITALCEGESNDGCHVNGMEYFIAQYMKQWDEPAWVYGKEQRNCKVNRWKPLKNCI